MIRYALIPLLAIGVFSGCGPVAEPDGSPSDDCNR